MVAFLFPVPVKFAASRSVTQTDSQSGSTSYAGVSFGADASTRQILVLAWHSGTSNNPGLTPTATIGGVSATRYEPHSTGDGAAGHATGTVFFIANPSGTTGTVSITWPLAGNITIVVLRMVGYSATPTSHDGGTTGSDDSTSDLSPSANDVAIAMAGNGFGNGLSLSNITVRGGSSTTKIWGWDEGKSAGAFSVGTSPWSSGIQGDGSRSAITFPAL